MWQPIGPKKYIFCVDATIFKRDRKNIFYPLKVKKKLPSKVAKKKSNDFFLTAQLAQTEEFTFQNVAYRPTV